MSGFAIKVNAAELLADMDAFADQAEAAARPAAQAAAQVYYDEVRANVGKLKRHTGNLASSIYQAYSRDNSNGGRAVYHVSWNARKAPHGHLVEFGHLQRYEVSFDRETNRFITHKDRPLPTPKLVAARSFVRSAGVAKSAAALDAAQAVFLREMGLSR